MPSDKERFMRRAIELSRDNMQAGQGGPFGAVVVKDGKIVGEGWNCVTSTNDPTAHAEMAAIRNACATLGTFSLEGCDLYTSCEPCPMCLTAAYWARIDRLYYGNSREDAARIDFDDDYFYRQVNLPVADRDLAMTRLLADEARTVFDEWQDKPDKVPY